MKSKGVVAISFMVLLLGLASCGGSGSTQSTFAPPPPSGAVVSHFVFVSNTTSNNISGFVVNKSNGALSPVGGSPFTTAPGPTGLAADPMGNFLVAANTDGQVSVFRIDRMTGALSAVPGSPFADHGQPIAVAIFGKFVFVGNRQSNDISAYILDTSTGALTAVIGSPFTTGSIAVQSLTIDVTVGSQSGLGGTPLLVVGGTGLANFRIESTGVLTLLKASAGGSPVNWVSAQAGYLYVLNSSGVDVFDEHIVPAALDCDPTANFLDCKVPGSPFAAGVGPFSAGGNRDGTVVFVASSGSSNVTSFSVGPGVFVPGAGALKQVDVAPAGTAPFSLAVENSGKFLYVVNQGSADVSAYSIDPTTHKLTVVPGSRFNAEAGSSFITTVQ